MQQNRECFGHGSTDRATIGNREYSGGPRKKFHFFVWQRAVRDL